MLILCVCVDGKCWGPYWSDPVCGNYILFPLIWCNGIVWIHNWQEGLYQGCSFEHSRLDMQKISDSKKDVLASSSVWLGLQNDHGLD